MKCPRCQATERQVKSGFHDSGSQRFKCQLCGKRYAPDPTPQGHPEETRQKAVQMYLDGMSFRCIGRHLRVSPQSVANWVNAHVAQLPAAPEPAQVETVEMDELFTFIEDKKSEPTS